MKKDYDDIKSMLGRVRYLKESTVTNYGRYSIRVFEPKNYPDDKQYLSEHSNEIFDFMEKGYQMALNDSFHGCNDIKSLKRNANLFKIAFSESGEYIAISLYSGYAFGKKCVGISATTNPKLRDLGKEAVKKIIEFDAQHPLEFYWCECSDKIYFMMEKAGAIKIRSEFVQLYINKEVKIIDDYHYERLLADGKTVTKTIFGFNRKETFDEVYQQCKDEIDKKLKECEDAANEELSKINESLGSFDIEYAIQVIDDFYILVTELGYSEFPEEYIDLVKRCELTLSITGNKNDINIKRCLEACKNLLPCVTTLECHLYQGTEAIEPSNNTQTVRMIGERKK